MHTAQKASALTSTDWSQIFEEEYQGRQTHAFSKRYNIPLNTHDIWVVCRGVVQLCTLDPEGHESILGLAFPGMPFGTPLTQISAYEAIALTDVVLMYIHQTELEDSPLLAQRVLTQLNRRIQQTEVLLSLVHQFQTKARIKQLLLFLTREIGEPTPEGIRIWVRFTHQQIANLAGTNRVTVSRILSKLRKEGWLSTDPANHYVIHEDANFDL